jgi:hypothetical protein
MKSFLKSKRQIKRSKRRTRRQSKKVYKIKGG